MNRGGNVMPTGHYVIWTDEMDNTLKRWYPTKLNCDLCKMLGVTNRALRKRAAILGVTKAPDYDKIFKREHSIRQSIAEKGKYSPTHFKKGQHPSVETEFKAGVKPTEEEKEKRADGLRRVMYAERVRIKYGLPQKTKIKFKKKYDLTNYDKQYENKNRNQE